MSVSIIRMYRAIHSVDPEGKYRWYVRPGCEIEIEAMGYVNCVAFQATKEIFGHSSDFKPYFRDVFEKMEKITKALEEATDNK